MWGGRVDRDIGTGRLGNMWVLTHAHTAANSSLITLVQEAHGFIIVCTMFHDARLHCKI